VTSVEDRLDEMEADLAFCSNFLNLLVVADNSLRGEIGRNRRESVLHSKAQKRTLEKTVSTVSDIEERLTRVETQISVLFDTAGRIEQLLKSKANKPLRIRVKT